MILCCYTDINPAVKQALDNYAPDTQFVNVKGDKYAYWRAIASRWNGEEDLIIIEHDVEIHQDVVSSFTSCPKEWCIFGYRLYGVQLMLYAGLGCAKFSAELQQQISWQDIADNFRWCDFCVQQGDEPGYGCWHYLDGPIKMTLREKGFTSHIHGEVKHHHDYSWQDINNRHLTNGLVNGRVPFENALFILRCTDDYDKEDLDAKVGVWG